MDQGKVPSLLRQTITRGRFLDALERAEAARIPQEPTTFSSLIADVYPAFRLIGMPKPWAGDFGIEALVERYSNSPAWLLLEVWLQQRHLATEWMTSFAIFTLASHDNRPSRMSWAIPPVDVPPLEYPAYLTVKLEAWHPEFESKKSAAGRLGKELKKALAAHLKEVEQIFESRPAPAVATKNERRDLEWVALNQVHGWSPQKIADSYRVGRRSREGHTGRPYVSRTLEHWKEILEF